MRGRGLHSAPTPASAILGLGLWHLLRDPSVIHSSGQDLTSERRFTPSSFLSPSPSLPSPHCSAWDLGRQGVSGAYKPQPRPPTHGPQPRDAEPRQTQHWATASPTTHFTGSVEAHGGPLWERIEESQAQPGGGCGCSLACLEADVCCVGHREAAPLAQGYDCGGLQSTGHFREEHHHALLPTSPPEQLWRQKPPSTGSLPK